MTPESEMLHSILKSHELTVATLRETIQQQNHQIEQLLADRATVAAPSAPPGQPPISNNLRWSGEEIRAMSDVEFADALAEVAITARYPGWKWTKSALNALFHNKQGIAARIDAGLDRLADEGRVEKVTYVDPRTRKEIPNYEFKAGSTSSGPSDQEALKSGGITAGPSDVTSPQPYTAIEPNWEQLSVDEKA